MQLNLYRADEVEYFIKYNTASSMKAKSKNQKFNIKFLENLDSFNYLKIDIKGKKYKLRSFVQKKKLEF